MPYLARSAALPLLATLASAQGPVVAADSKPPGPRVVVETFSGELNGGTGGMEVGPDGTVYCADFGARLNAGPGGAGGLGDKVFALDADGRERVFVSGMRGASGNAFGPDGSFYQSSIGGNFITRVAPDGTSSVFLRQGLRSPVGIAVDGEGVLFVANCGGNSVLEVTPDGDHSVFCASPLLKCPNGIALDEEHNLYVANFGNGDVIRIDWAGEATRLATLPGKNNGHLIHHEGYLYVVARGAHRIFRVSLEGEVEPFAGSGERGHDDGPALEATFSFPNDIAVAPDGKTFYVNENASTTLPHTELAPMLVRRVRVLD